MTDFLVTACRRAGVEFVRAAVQGLVLENGAVTGLRINGETVGCDSVIVATGGLSYPQTLSLIHISVVFFIVAYLRLIVLHPCRAACRGFMQFCI